MCFFPFHTFRLHSLNSAGCPAAPDFPILSPRGKSQAENSDSYASICYSPIGKRGSRLPSDDNLKVNYVRTALLNLIVCSAAEVLLGGTAAELELL